MNKGLRVTPNIFEVLFRGTSVLSRVTRGWAWFCLVHGVNRVTEDLSGAMRSLLVIDQSEMGVKSDWRRADRVDTLREMSGWETARVRSSAYDVMISAVVGQSWRKKLNRVGDITEPCGTPERIMRFGLTVVRYKQAAVLPRRYVASHRM